MGKYWPTSSEIKKGNEKALKVAEAQIRAGSFMKFVQQEMPLDVNKGLNLGLPVPLSSPRINPTPHNLPPGFPYPHQISPVPKDPDYLNFYFSLPISKRPQPTVGRDYQRGVREILKQRKRPQQLEFMSPEEWDYHNNNPFRPDYNA